MDEKIYPTPVDEQGFFIENSDDEAIGASTKVYDNGNKIKQIKLPVCGKIAVVRELIGKDTKEIARFMDKDPEKYQMSAVVVATIIDGSKQPFDYYEGMKLKDYQRLLSMYQDLNF